MKSDPAKRRQPRGRGDAADRLWSEAGSSHPGIRDPRSVRAGDWHPAINAMIIATLALVTLVAIAAAWTSSPVEEVTQWHQWTSERGELSLEHPAGWRVIELPAARGQVHVLVMRSQWVRIHLIAEPDIALTARAHAGYNTRGELQYANVEHVHRMTASVWEGLLGKIDEGAFARTVIGNRRAVWSQFRYSGRHIEGGEMMTGYRATIVANHTGLIASAVAPSRYWNRFKPTALHVLRSISLGGGTQSQRQLIQPRPRAGTTTPAPVSPRRR